MEKRNNINLTVGDLKDFLANVKNDMPVIIPVIDEDDSNHILGYRNVRTIGILQDNYGPPEDRTALCLCTSNGDLDISQMIKRPDIVCKKVIF